MEDESGLIEGRLSLVRGRIQDILPKTVLAKPSSRILNLTLAIEADGAVSERPLSLVRGQIFQWFRDILPKTVLAKTSARVLN